MDKTNKFKDELSSKQEDYLLEEERDSINDDLKNEEIMQKSNSIDDGLFDNWIFENHSNLVSEFIGENNEQFKEFCKIKYKEVKE